MDNKEEVSLKEIRERFYRLRDFEISNLWQRSIFLSAILVLFFSGYGLLISKCFENNNYTMEILFHEVACAIALCAIVFSIIWIMMAKGSKAWYEVYEKKICEIEKEEELKISEKYQMRTTRCEPKSLDSNLFSHKPGRYSVSKLNIIIGQFLLAVWFIIFIIHYIGTIIAFKLNFCDVNCVIHTIALTLFLISLLFIIISALCNKWAKSSALE